MPVRAARVGRVGVIGAPVARTAAKTAVVAKAVTPGPAPVAKTAAPAVVPPAMAPPAKSGKAAAAVDSLRNAVVHVLHNQRAARLMLERRPASKGLAWLKYNDDGQEIEASLKSVTLVALLVGQA